MNIAKGSNYCDMSTCGIASSFSTMQYSPGFLYYSWSSPGIDILWLLFATFANFNASLNPILYC